MCDLPVRPKPYYWAVFLDNDIVGTLCYNKDATKLAVLAVNRTTGKDSFIVTDLAINTEVIGGDSAIFSIGLATLFLCRKHH
jgi:hypothetical protein